MCVCVLLMGIATGPGVGARLQVASVYVYVFSHFAPSSLPPCISQSIFKSSPLMGCFLFGLPLGVISIMCYGIYTADTEASYIEERYDLAKDMDGNDLLDEAPEQHMEVRNGHPPMPAMPEPKDELEKKTD